MKITITITKDDILNGRRCDPDCCPVGRALSRAGVPHCGVIGPTVVVVDGQDHPTVLPLPQSVSEWILDFDGCRQVEPFNFELALPAHPPAPTNNGSHAAPQAAGLGQLSVAA